MQRPAAEAVARASEKLHAKGFGLLIHDAYRPWYVTKIFWDATPPEDHKFVADPAEGSRHNRGCAVDLTMYDLKTGEAVPMTGLYDEMSERSYPNYKGGTEEERRNRETLRAAMEAEGFTVYEFEWWHFDYKDYKKYPILNLKFADVPSATNSPGEKKGHNQHPTSPRALVNPEPQYSALARQHHLRGSVVSWVFIGADGDVKQVVPTAFRVSSRDPKPAPDPTNPSEDLDMQTVKAVRNWKFEPAKEGKISVPTMMTVEIAF
jgi:hypothetical protein